IGICCQYNAATTSVREAFAHLGGDRQATLCIHIDGMTAEKVAHLPVSEDPKKPQISTRNHFLPLAHTIETPTGQCKRRKQRPSWKSSFYDNRLQSSARAKDDITEKKRKKIKHL